MANCVDMTCQRRNQSSFYPKFVASSITNVTLSVIKDKAFAAMFGVGPPKKMSLKTMGLFGTRDSMTILASFSLPALVSAEMQRKGVGKGKADTLAQLLAPVSMQLFSTPLHLLGLDLYNRPDATQTERGSFIRNEYVKTTMARMARIFPAFGVGGVVNTGIRKHGTSALSAHYAR